MGEKEGQKIIEHLLGIDKNLKDAASFISGIGLSEGETYALQVPAVNGQKPGEGDIERYYKETHHGTTIHDMIIVQLEFFKANISLENIKFMKDVFFNFFEESWDSYQKDGKQYSAYFDSQGLYSKEELDAFDKKGIINPLDSSERYTGIRLKVSTREKLKKWDAARGYGKRRSFDDIILDVLQSKGIENLDSTVIDPAPHETEIIRLIQQGINTTEEMKKEFFDERGISLRTVNHTINGLMRKGVIFKKRRGNLIEYFVKTPELLKKVYTYSGQGVNNMGESYGDMKENKVIKSMITATTLHRYFSLLNVTTRHVEGDRYQYIVSLRNKNNTIASEDWDSLLKSMKNLKYDFWYMDAMDAVNGVVVIWFTSAVI